MHPSLEINDELYDYIMVNVYKQRKDIVKTYMNYQSTISWTALIVRANMQIPNLRYKIYQLTAYIYSQYAKCSPKELQFLAYL
jgi:hypothetical protein